jgi:hypothetical protein
MASNDEHFAIHLKACVLGSHQFHLRLETNASVSLKSTLEHLLWRIARTSLDERVRHLLASIICVILSLALYRIPLLLTA